MNKASGKSSVGESVFHSVCLASTWKLMSAQLESFLLRIPDLEEVLASPMLICHYPLTIVDNASSMSSKRKRSACDGATSGGVSRNLRLQVLRPDYN